MVLHSLALAMWPPFGSRLCPFSIVAKDWQFWLEFHLRFIVICQFLEQSGHWSCFSSVMYFVILRLGASRVECSSLPHSLLWLSS